MEYKIAVNQLATCIVRKIICIFLVLAISSCTKGIRPQSVADATSNKNANASVLSNQSLIGLGVIYVAPVEILANINFNSSKSQVLTQGLLNGLREQLELDFISANLVDSQLGTKKISRTESFNRAAASAADGVLFLQVDRFIDRNGSAIDSSQGAEVAMTMRIYNIADGQEVWSRSFGFKDRAASENLLALGARTKQQNQADSHGWLTAEQLYNNGVKELAQSFGLDRLSAFSH